MFSHLLRLSWARGGGGMKPQRACCIHTPALNMRGRKLTGWYCWGYGTCVLYVDIFRHESILRTPVHCSLEIPLVKKNHLNMVVVVLEWAGVRLSWFPRHSTSVRRSFSSGDYRSLHQATAAATTAASAQAYPLYSVGRQFSASRPFANRAAAKFCSASRTN